VLPTFASGAGRRRVEEATSGLGEVMGITGGRSLEVVVTFPMPPDASDDLPTQPHMRTPFPTQSNQPAAVRARPQDRRVRRPAQSRPGHACQTRARVAWLMPSDRSEVRHYLPRRDHLTSPARDRRSRCFLAMRSRRMPNAEAPVAPPRRAPASPAQQVFSAMRAELRRALTTATAPCTITLGRRCFWR